MKEKQEMKRRERKERIQEARRRKDAGEDAGEGRG